MKIIAYGIAAASIAGWFISRFDYSTGSIADVLLSAVLLATLWLVVMQWRPRIGPVWAAFRPIEKQEASLRRTKTGTQHRTARENK